MSKKALEKACDKAGGQAPLAELIGTTQSQIWYWLNRATKGVPAEFAIKIEEKTGVPRYDLRPDIFGTPKQRASA
jgi:DNA-binding transcriptional regulator YdaS (Cro superfamily)